MVTSELHVKLEELLQKVNSHWNQNFLPQEKDSFINAEILRFIKQRLSPLSNNKRQGIFDIIKRDQDLNSLLRTVRIPVVNHNQREDMFYLPFNFLFYVSSSLDVFSKCSKSAERNKNTLMYEVSFAEILDINTLTALQIDLVRNTTTTLLFNLNELPLNYLPQDNIDNYKKAFILNNAILMYLKSRLPLNEVEVEYKKSVNTFYIRSYKPFTININSNLTINTNSTTHSLIGNNDTNLLEADLRIIDEEFKTNVKASYLSGAKPKSAIGYLRDTSVILPKQESVVYSYVELTYLCKPKKVDVLLNFNSDLSEQALLEVIDNTARTLKGVISSDSYDKYVSENLLIE